MPTLVAFSIAAPVLTRPPMIVAIAALVILLTRRGGPLHRRIAAAGRAAFTNYLGTSILMTALFYGWGFGLYGDSQPHPALDPGRGDVGVDAALVEALARPLQLRPVRMAVAKPGPRADVQPMRQVSASRPSA